MLTSCLRFDNVHVISSVFLLVEIKANENQVFASPRPQVARQKAVNVVWFLPLALVSAKARWFQLFGVAVF